MPSSVVSVGERARKEIMTTTSPLRSVTSKKDLLLKRLDELYSEAERTVAGMKDNEENLPDPCDRATLESDRDCPLRIHDRERHLIVKIREALQRIEEGNFGLCKECGDDIGFEHLSA